ITAYPIHYLYYILLSCINHYFFNCILCQVLPTSAMFSSNSPFKEHVFASVILTSTIFSIIYAGLVKFTTLFFSVYRDNNVSSFLLSLSTSTFTVCPSLVFIDSADCLFTISLNQYNIRLEDI